MWNSHTCAGNISPPSSPKKGRGNSGEGRVPIRKFTVCLQPIRKEIVRSMYMYNKEICGISLNTLYFKLFFVIPLRVKWTTTVTTMCSFSLVTIARVFMFLCYSRGSLKLVCTGGITVRSVE